MNLDLNQKDDETMKQEERQLLLKDLCARLPYGVKIELTWWIMGKATYINTTLESYDIEQLLNNEDNDTEIKPYLRQMSSMTEEEIIEFNNIPSTKNYQIVKGDLPWDVANYKQIGWLLKNHFDFMGLIQKGLAIEVTEENNPYKE